MLRAAMLWRIRDSVQNKLLSRPLFTTLIELHTILCRNYCNYATESPLMDYFMTIHNILIALAIIYKNIVS